MGLSQMRYIFNDRILCISQYLKIIEAFIMTGFAYIQKFYFPTNQGLVMIKNHFSDINWNILMN